MRSRDWLILTLLVIGAIFIVLPLFRPELAASWLMRGAALLVMIAMFAALLNLPPKTNK